MSTVTATTPVLAGPPPTVAEAGRPALVAAIDRIKQLLVAHRDGVAGPQLGTEEPAAPEQLDRIVVRLGLSPFERDVLLLAAAVELDSEAAALVAEVGSGDPRATMALAMAVLPAAHWDAVSPERPLRRWGLVELLGGAALVTRPVVVDEHVLHTLVGLTGSGSTLGGLAVPEGARTTLTPRQVAVAEEVAASVAALPAPLLLRLDGDDHDAQLAICARVAGALDRQVLQVRDAVLADGDLRSVARLLDREALIGDRLVVTSTSRLVRLLESPVVAVVGPSGSPDQPIADELILGRTTVARRVDRPSGEEQAGLWERALGVRGRDRAVAAAAREVAHHYRLSARSIGAIAAELAAVPDSSAAELRRLARTRARVGLGSLAERIEVRARWDELVLPEGQLAMLHDIARQVRHRSQVYDEWGFGRRANRGCGVTAMFAGESGTGKTMAAEVIAGELGLDLYRIDLSAVVSKYIGETEKNLRRLFDAAESGGAVLLFDEADALFGRRSEVKDSHDRYANLEVAYLLQRMESYRGLAVLTTNLRANVDRAFLRRLRFVVQLPFPDRRQRAELWRRAFPEQTPTEGLDPEALAQLQVPGGSIHAIAVSAAFAAADEGSPVRPEHVLRGARVEYAKAERTLTDAETAALTGGSR